MDTGNHSTDLAISVLRVLPASNNPCFLLDLLLDLLLEEFDRATLVPVSVQI